jgi:hypothetical protein
MDMAFFWLVFLGCAVCAWLIGYGMGYLQGVKEAITTHARNGDLDFSGDGSGREIEAPMPRWMRRLLAPSRYAEPLRRRRSASGERRETGATDLGFC